MISEKSGSGLSGEGALPSSEAETFSGTPLSPAADAQPTVGRYRMLQKVGEGGMGEVWEAEQQAPVRRRVAVKVIKRAWTPRWWWPASRPSGRPSPS